MTKPISITQFFKALFLHFTKWFRLYPIYGSECVYVFRVTNEGDEEKEAILFGYNHCKDLPNYGNDAEIKIESLSHYTHDVNLKSFSQKPYFINGFRFSSQNRIELITPIVKIFKDKDLVKEIHLSQQQSIFQYATDIIEIGESNSNKQIHDRTIFDMNKHTHFSLNIKSKASLVVGIYAQTIQWMSYFELKDMAEINPRYTIWTSFSNFMSEVKKLFKSKRK